MSASMTVRVDPDRSRPKAPLANCRLDQLARHVVDRLLADPPDQLAYRRLVGTRSVSAIRQKHRR